MAACSPPSLVIRSSSCLNNGITQTWKFPAASFLTGKNKTRRGSETLIVTGKHIYRDLFTSALPSYGSSNKICASKTCVEPKEPVSTRGDGLKKVASSYLFRAKSGALVKVKVEKKSEKYSVMVYISSLEPSVHDKSRLVMVWGVYRSDSSCFLPLDFENSDQDSQTPFVKSSLSELMLGLEFDGNESPFYLSFRLKLVSANDPNGLEMLSHRDTNFCVPVGLTAGHPLPLGLSSGPDGDSWNFAFFSRNSKGVVLCLFDDVTTDKPALELDLDPYVNRTGDVWHASVEKAWDFVRYGYRCKEAVHSEEEDEVDVEAEKIVLDPYATVIEKSVSQKFLGSLFKNPSFDWGRDVSPNIPLEKLIVYRLIVKGFTQHKSSKLPTDVAGTFSGVAEKVNHLKALGTNAVLLEPIFSFSEQQGPYFPVHFFSPMDMYGKESAVNLMKEMVKGLHSQGIEVLLEVVFTHTAESGALRGIDGSSYYYKGRDNDLDAKSYLNCNYPVVQQLILESLRYWVTEFHVDGFCFINASSLLRGVHGEQLSRPPLVEAISFDPLLAGTKLIADCWDPHDMKMPKEVKFPHWKRWAELNTIYCRDVRNFVRGRGVISDLATRVCGSGDMFTDGRGPAFSFNYISRNSGLSLVDLVSFSGPDEETVVVFDEAHNIDNVCIEALSVSVRKVTLEGANRNLNKIRQEIDRFKASDAGRLRAEYNRLVEGLALRGDLSGTDQWLANPALPHDILKEAVPGNIRRAEHFVHVLRRLLQYLEGRLDTENVEKESPVSFVSSLNSQAGIEQKTLKFCYDRLHSLMMTLEITDTDEFLPIQTVCDFATLVGTYARGFSIIIEPYDERMPHIPDPILQLSCHDASLAIKPVFDRFQSVVITSGTLSPIDLYPRLLSFNPVVSRSFKMSMTRDCICPMVLTRGSDQLPVSTKFDMRSDPGVVRNYGKLLVEMVSVVPDGVVCFFVSYSYMDGIIATWNETGILKEITQQKLVFFETQDVVETTLALDNYRRACDCGRGAVFFSVARGKVAEGIDFDRHYGRLVVMFGVPFQYTLSKILLARLEYLRDTFQIKEGDFLTFDALRQAAQCVGRVIRSKADYGMMIFADKRYSRHDKRSKLPGWILSHLRDAHLNLSTDMAIHIAREFLRKMAQPYDKTGTMGRKTLLTQEDLEKMAETGVQDMVY